jgi:signal transduction histidine kinase
MNDDMNKKSDQDQNKKWKVLITDDEELIHVMITGLLEGYEFNGQELELFHAYSGEAAKAVLREHTDIVVIILDVRLEKRDTGFHMVQYIRETLKNSLIKIILLTAESSIDDFQEYFFKYDIDMYCTKQALNKILYFMTSSLRAYERSYTNDQLNKQLKQELINQQTAKDELKELNEKLGHLVQNKDVQLERTTDSLHEAIAYAKQLAQEAEASNQSKSRFLANFSHEIRTPMNGIIGMLDLAMQSGLNKSQHEYVSLAKQSADHMLFLINDILDFSKIASNKLQIHNQVFSIQNIIESAMTPLKMNALEKGLDLLYDIDPLIPEKLYGPHDRLLQILINLIKNAVKFSECNDVHIKARIHDKPLPEDSIEVLFSVIDQGIGMDQEIIKNIFDPFFQGHLELSESKGGLGLGLSICKQLVDMIGGHIWAESTPDKGSSFNFILPFKLINNVFEETDSHISEQDISFKAIRKEKPNILVVEDHCINQMVCEDILVRNGYEVTVVMNGAEAVEAFQKDKYDLILMDIKMPEMDGITATKKIRNLENQDQRIPIIALTALAAENEKVDCLNAGMDIHISKPFDPPQMIMTIEKYLKAPSVQKKTSVSSKFKLMPGKSFDLEALKKKNNNDMAVVHQKINVLKSNGKKLLAQIEKTLTKGNELLLGKYVHKLMNIASDAGARRISDNAFRCKLALRKDDIENAQQMFIKLKKDYEIFLSEIQHIQ